MRAKHPVKVWGAAKTAPLNAKKKGRSSYAGEIQRGTEKAEI